MALFWHQAGFVFGLSLSRGELHERNFTYKSGLVYGCSLNALGWSESLGAGERGLPCCSAMSEVKVSSLSCVSVIGEDGLPAMVGNVLLGECLC